jgi:multisubunit Na+/H+ antiporter MnhG subunit
MPVIAIAAVAALGLVAGLLRALRVHRKPDDLRKAVTQGAVVTGTTAAIALAALYAAAVVALLLAVVFLFLAAEAGCSLPSPGRSRCSSACP